MVGLLLIIVCVVISRGLTAGWDFVVKTARGVIESIKGLFGFAIQFPDDLGITEWLWTNGIYIIIALTAAAFTGYFFTRKEKKKILGIISAVVSVVSLLFTFV